MKVQSMSALKNVTDPFFDKIAIVGVGLLGGSLGMTALENGIAREVIGITRSHPSIEEAKRHGAITSGTTNLAEGVAQADLIVLCTPVNHIIGILPDVMKHCKPDAIITDVGSTKASIVENGELIAAQFNRHFVGSHPMAGSEKSGVRYAKSDLYKGATCFVTKTENTSVEAFKRVCHFWKSLECRLAISRPHRHDRLVAAISHLPHVVAVATVLAVESFGEDKNLIKGILGNGFRDTTRVAAGDSRMWENICFDNRDEIIKTKQALEESLNTFMAACENTESSELKTLLENAREFREFLNQK